MIEEELNTRCDLTFNGESCLHKFEAYLNKTCCDHKYIAVLTDLNMPVMDGFEASLKMQQLQDEKIEKNPDFIRIPIIAVSAYDREQWIKKSRECRMD